TDTLGSSQSKFAQWGAVAYSVFLKVKDFVINDLIPAGEKIRDAFVVAFDAVLAAVQRVWPIVQQIVGTVVADFRQYAPDIKQIFEQVASNVSDAFTLIGTVISKAVAVISFVWDHFGKYILNAITIVFGFVVD